MRNPRFVNFRMFTDHTSRITSLVLAGSFFLRDRHATRSLACPSVGVCALTANWKSSAVAQTSIAADVPQSFDVHLNLLSQIAFDSALLVDHGANLVDFFFSQFANALINTDARFP